jgi:hypothetical protein
MTISPMTSFQSCCCFWGCFADFSGIIGYGHIGAQLSVLAEAMGIAQLTGKHDHFTNDQLGNTARVAEGGVEDGNTLVGIAGMSTSLVFALRRSSPHES